MLAELIDLAKSALHLGPEMLIETVGVTAAYIAIFTIVFAESGLLFGFFLPGDSLLFTAGFLASQEIFSLPLLMVGCVIAAISGDAVGFAFGKRVGRRLYERPDSRFFKKRHLLAAERFYERHGGKTIIMARFLPIVRTMAPIVAGTANMNYRRFVTYNAVGGVLWGAGMPAAGYVLGSVIPNVDRYLLPVLAAIILLSLLPSAGHMLLERRHARARATRVALEPAVSPATARHPDALLREEGAEPY